MIIDIPFPMQRSAGRACKWKVPLADGQLLIAFLLALRRLVFPLTLVYAGIYAVGIAMVHAKADWFVVGAGRNGAEYSVLLIVALLCVGLQHMPARERAPQVTHYSP